MPTLSDETIHRLLEPYVAPFAPSVDLSPKLIRQISIYLDLLIRWNARVSLTAIRRPEDIVQRHFGESLFTAAVLSTRLPPSAELLDYGTGPGFPGIPIQLALPNLRVTLAESQSKKVAFLREVLRILNLPTEIWPHRVEDLPPDRRFDAVTLRAVEKMAASVDEAQSRVRDNGFLAALVGGDFELDHAEEFRMPSAEQRRVLVRQIVPRGTIADPKL